jgi:hypothetical protein
MSAFQLDKLLYQLNANAETFAAFLSNPDAVLDRYELSEAERSGLTRDCHHVSVVSRGVLGYLCEQRNQADVAVMDDRLAPGGETECSTGFVPGSIGSLRRAAPTRFSYPTRKPGRHPSSDCARCVET